MRPLRALRDQWAFDRFALERMPGAQLLGSSDQQRQYRGARAVNELVVSRRHCVHEHCRLRGAATASRELIQGAVVRRISVGRCEARHKPQRKYERLGTAGCATGGRPPPGRNPARKMTKQI